MLSISEVKRERAVRGGGLHRPQMVAPVLTGTVAVTWAGERRLAGIACPARVAIARARGVAVATKRAVVRAGNRRGGRESEYGVHEQHLI